MCKSRILSVATILAFTFAIGAKAETVILAGEDVVYEINLPDATTRQGDGAVTGRQSVEGPQKQAALASNASSTSQSHSAVTDQQAAGEAEKKAVPASNDQTPNGTVGPDPGLRFCGGE
jgi:hypothetical protein